MFFSKNIIFLLFFQAPLIILGQDTAESKLKTQTIRRTKDNGFKIDTVENSPTGNNTSSEETVYDEDDEENSKHSRGTSTLPSDFDFLKYFLFRGGLREKYPRNIRTFVQ